MELGILPIPPPTIPPGTPTGAEGPGREGAAPPMFGGGRGWELFDSDKGPFGAFEEGCPGVREIPISISRRKRRHSLSYLFDDGKVRCLARVRDRVRAGERGETLVRATRRVSLLTRTNIDLSCIRILDG